MRKISGNPFCRMAHFQSKFGSQMMYEHRSYYEVLNVPLNSSGSVIKRAFIKLCKKYHPDGNSRTCDSEEFAKVCEAYKILSQRASRQHTSERRNRQRISLAMVSPENPWAKYQAAVRLKQLGHASVTYKGSGKIQLKPLLLEAPMTSVVNVPETVDFSGESNVNSIAQSSGVSYVKPTIDFSGESSIACLVNSNRESNTESSNDSSGEPGIEPLAESSGGPNIKSIVQSSGGSNLEATINFSGESSIERLVESGGKFNVEPTVRPIDEFIVEPIAESSSGSNVEANVDGIDETSIVPIIEPNVEPIIGPIVESYDGQTTRLATYQERVHRGWKCAFYMAGFSVIGVLLTLDRVLIHF